MKDSTSLKAAQLAVLLVGPPKTGKTCLALSFPRPFVLDLDLNLDSAVRVLEGKPFKVSQPALEVGVTVDSEGKLQNADKVWAYSMAELKMAATSPEVDTIIIDGLTKLSDFCIAHILAEVSRIEGKRIDTMRIQDYGRFMSLFQRLITFLRATGKIIVCTCHQTVSKDEMTQANHYSLALPGQLKDTFGGFFTDAWGVFIKQLGGGKQAYEILTVPNYQTVPLGTSVRTMGASVDITGLKPREIAAKLLPLVGLKP